MIIILAIFISMPSPRTILSRGEQKKEMAKSISLAFPKLFMSYLIVTDLGVLCIFIWLYSMFKFFNRN